MATALDTALQVCCSEEILSIGPVAIAFSPRSEIQMMSKTYPAPFTGVSK